MLEASRKLDNLSWRTTFSLRSSLEEISDIKLDDFSHIPLQASVPLIGKLQTTPVWFIALCTEVITGNTVFLFLSPRTSQRVAHRELGCRHEDDGTAGCAT